MKPAHNARMAMALVGSMLFFSSPEVALSQSLDRQELDEAGSHYLMTISAPADATPEAILATILENPNLPKHIRDPYVALARAKAPHLLSEVAQAR